MNFGDELTEQQGRLVDLLAQSWAMHWEWPTFNFVADALDSDGIDALHVLRSFPALGVGSSLGAAYSDVFFEHTYPAPRDESLVGVTATGLARHRLTEGTALTFMAILKLAANLYVRLPPDPANVKEVVLTFEEATDQIPGASPDILSAAVKVFTHEAVEGYKGVVLHGDGTWTIRFGRGIAKYANVNVETYAAKLFDDFGARSPLPGETNLYNPETAMPEKEGTAVTSGQDKQRTVFVIYGRNERARRALFEFLRAVGLKPIEWSKAIAMTGKGSPYIGEVLDVAFSAAQAVVVLQTPDDIAYLHPSLTSPDDEECDPMPQPRQNVLFEAGMAMGRDQDRTIMVDLGRVRGFSDAHGRHVVRLDNTVGKRQDLIDRLEATGCAVDVTGNRDWHEAGDLTPPPPPGGGLPLGRRLPATHASGLPRLDARLVDNGGTSLSDLVITNHGPGDILNLNVEMEEKPGLSAHPAAPLPVPRLPRGKSVKALRIHDFQHSASYFTVTVTGQSESGEDIREAIFVSEG